MSGKLDTELQKVFSGLNQQVSTYKFMFKGKEFPKDTPVIQMNLSGGDSLLAVEGLGKVHTFR